MAYLGNSPANALFNLSPPVTLSAGQTSVNINYTPGRTLFLLNGAVQTLNDDVTATDGSTVTLTSAANAGDQLVAVNFASFSVANALPLSGGSLAGPISHAGGDTGVTPAQFDNTTLLSTTAFVKKAMGNFSSWTAYNTGGAPALTSANAGTAVVLSGVTAGTLYLPPLSTCPVGTAFLIKSEVAGIWNISCAGVDGSALVVNGAGAAAINSLALDSWVMVVASGTWWRTYGTAVGFQSSFAGPGYQRLPSGLIMQWGSATITTAGTFQTVTLPLSYPNGQLNFSCTSATPGAYGVGGTNSGSKTTGAVTGSVSAGLVYWSSLGW